MPTPEYKGESPMWLGKLFVRTGVIPVQESTEPEVNAKLIEKLEAHKLWHLTQKTMMCSFYAEVKNLLDQ